MAIEQFSVAGRNGKIYYLNTKMVTLKGGKYEQRIFYFSLDLRPDTSTGLPLGYEVGEAKNGLPVVRKVH